MNSLDVYCLSHFEDKQYYAWMVEVALTLDRKDFLPDGYPVDEEVYPRVPPKPAGRKGKAPASFSHVEEETIDDKKQEDDADIEEEDDAVNLSDDEIGAPGGSEPPLTLYSLKWKNGLIMRGPASDLKSHGDHECTYEKSKYCIEGKKPNFSMDHKF